MMPLTMPFEKYFLFILSSLGVFPFAYFIVKWSRKIFFTFRQMNKILSDDAVTDFGDAYKEESEKKARKADRQLAYTKLLALISPPKTKSFSKRVADLKSAQEYQLPADEYLLGLLCDVLKNQAKPDFETKYEALNYYLKVKE